MASRRQILRRLRLGDTGWATTIGVVLVLAVLAVVFIGPYLAPQSPTDSVDDVFLPLAVTFSAAKPA